MTDAGAHKLCSVHHYYMFKHKASDGRAHTTVCKQKKSFGSSTLQKTAHAYSHLFTPILSWFSCLGFCCCFFHSNYIAYNIAWMLLNKHFNILVESLNTNFYVGPLKVSFPRSSIWFLERQAFLNTILNHVVGGEARIYIQVYCSIMQATVLIKMIEEMILQWTKAVS